MGVPVSGQIQIYPIVSRSYVHNGWFYSPFWNDALNRLRCDTPYVPRPKTWEWPSFGGMVMKP